jgi:hypothetical protein
MNRSELIYRRTEAGAAVAMAEDPEIPAEYQRILRFLEVEADGVQLRDFLRGDADELVRQWLAELEELKLIEALPAANEQDADFTDHLRVAEIAAAYKDKAG